MRYKLLFIIVLGLTQSVNGGQEKNAEPDSIPGVIFKAEQSDAVKSFMKAEGTWTPTIEQIKELEVILPVYMLTYNSKDVDTIYENLSKYKRQYLGVRKNGDTLIYINGLGEKLWKKSEWKTRFIRISNREKHSFYAYFNPRLHRFEYLVWRTGR